MEDAAQNRPVVIDNGTGILKAGFAGSDKPKCVFPSFVGRPKHKRIMVQSKVEGDVFLGRDAEEHRGIMKLEYTMRHGIVENWADMEKIWSYVYGKTNLSVNSEEHPVRVVSCDFLFALFYSNADTDALFRPASTYRFCLPRHRSTHGKTERPPPNFFLRRLGCPHSSSRRRPR